MILDYYVRRITIAAASLVSAARCSARSTRTACALGVIARVRILVLAGRTAAVGITRCLLLLLVIVIHEFDVVRNQVIDTASVLQQAIRRTEGMRLFTSLALAFFSFSTAPLVMKRR